MGAVRLFLALSVLVYHRVGQKSFLPSIDIWPLPGNSAVEAFFLVSGFFMSLVLTTRYADLPLRAFYASRALRLYPSYLLALAFAIALAPLVRFGMHKVSYGFPYMLGDIGNWTSGEIVLWFFTNLGMLGKEIWFFNGGTWTDFVTPGHEAVLSRLNTYQIISPAWSLSVELQFYLCAPFLARLRTRTLLVVGLASLVARIGVQVAGYSHDPYSYYVLPGQLCIFLLGMLSHRCLGRWTKATTVRSAYAISAGLCLWIVFYPWVSHYAHFDWMKWLLFAGLYLCVTASGEDQLGGRSLHGRPIVSRLPPAPADHLCDRSELAVVVVVSDTGRRAIRGDAYSIGGARQFRGQADRSLPSSLVFPERLERLTKALQD